MHLLFADEKKIVYKHSLQHEKRNHYRGTKATNVPLMYPSWTSSSSNIFFYRLLHFWILYRSFETGRLVLDETHVVQLYLYLHPFCDDHISSLFNFNIARTNEMLSMKISWSVNYWERITSSIESLSSNKRVKAIRRKTITRCNENWSMLPEMSISSCSYLIN